MISKHILVTLIVIATIISGCDMNTTQKITGGNKNKEVDFRFREFYDWLGGEAVLGSVISDKIETNGYEYQYTAASLMVYIPNEVEDQRYQLAPLGLELGLAEPPLNPDYPGGHEIYPGFLGLYDQMGGSRYVGQPITEAHYNAEKRRIEQHFENVGFYHLEAEFDGVGLIHYGAWKCENHCGFTSPEEAEVVIWSAGDSSFNAAVQRLDPTFTGYPLTEPYISSDGVLEQIFEYVVIIADNENPGNIRLRPILEMIGVPIQKGGDYSIPPHLLEFINHNSGLGFAGLPVTEYSALSSEVYRQCFRNLCLDYFPNANDGFEIRPAPLGYTYKRMYYQPLALPADELIPKEITIRVWKTHAYLANDKSQEIGVKLESRGEPFENYSPELILDIPGRGEISYLFPPTNQDGTTYLVLEPLDVPNGTRIEYWVCVNNPSTDNHCISDDFLIWAE
jgi:hypothetical protein